MVTRGAINNWRDFFRLLDPCGIDLWTVCERALAISYHEDPLGFASNRDALAQKLFAPEKLDLVHRFPADVVLLFEGLCRGEESQPDAMGANNKCGSIVRSNLSRFDCNPDDVQNGILNKSPCEGDLSRFDRKCPDVIHDRCGETATQFSDDGNEEDNDDGNGVTYASFRLDEAEALTKELEDEMLYKQEVLAIKQSLEEKSYQSEREIYDSLQRLELMDLSFDLLKETEIGKVVNGLRKSSPSTRVASLAKRLVRGWKELVHACCKSAIAVAAAATTEYGATCVSSLSVFDEEPGLPSPPMDEAALLGVSTASVDMFQLWDLMEDVTSVEACCPTKERDNKHENLWKENESRPHIGGPSSTVIESKKAKQVSSVITRTNVRREGTSSIHPLSKPQHKFQQKVENIGTRHQDTIDEKMESAKRNLRINYEREQNAKKQRTIQVLDLHDLPKGGPTRAKIPHLMHGKSTSQARPRVLICR